MKTNLSQVFVKRVECEQGKSKQEFYDNEIKGFFLEVRANKSKTYFLKAIVDKKRVTKKIGDANVMDIKSARVKALKLKRAVEEGKDIVIGRSSKNKSSILTLEAFYEEYYIPYIKMHIKSYETNISVFKNHILPKFRNSAMNDITKKDIMQLHTNMVQKKEVSTCYCK